MFLLQKALQEIWEYSIDIINGCLFCDKKDGWIHALDNQIKQLHRAGKHVVHHNIIPAPDIVRLIFLSLCTKMTGKHT